MYNTMKPYCGKIIDMISKTWETPFCEVSHGIYPIIKTKTSFPTVDHTDGIGTKGFYHWNNKTFKNAVLDALAMNLNDLSMCGAEPFKLQNHIFLPEDNNDAIFEIMDSLVEECLKRNIAITGGETSIHNNMNGMDISITISGLVRFRPRPHQYTLGDSIIGIRSNGLHSNGFTKVHEIFKDIDRPEFTTPTKIYELREVYMHCNALNHITGGAYTKLLNSIPHNVDVHLDFDFPGTALTEKDNLSGQIFFELAKNMSTEDMFKTFNCGYGFLLSVPKDKVDYVLKETDGDVLGSVEKGHGKVRIKSPFDDAFGVIYGKEE